MAVAEVRDSEHFNELRMFTIDDHGIQLGNMISDYEGLLGGRPTSRPAARPLTGHGDG